MDSLGVFVDQTYSKSGQIRLCRPVRLLRSVVQNPDSESNCLSVPDWCELVLFPAKRGGKRHNKRPRGCVCGPTCPTKARSLCTSSCFAAYITHMSHSRVQQPNWKTAAVMTRQQCVRPWVLLNCRRTTHELHWICAILRTSAASRKFRNMTREKQFSLFHQGQQVARMISVLNT